MARCPSSQDLLTAAILRQKWIDAVSAEVIDVYESLLAGRPFEVETRKLSAFLIEMTSSEAMKRNRFKGRGSLIRALEEALEKAHTVVDDASVGGEAGAGSEGVALAHPRPNHGDSSANIDTNLETAGGSSSKNGQSKASLLFARLVTLVKSSAT